MGEFQKQTFSMLGIDVSGYSKVTLGVQEFAPIMRSSTSPPPTADPPSVCFLAFMRLQGSSCSGLRGQWNQLDVARTMMLVVAHVYRRGKGVRLGCDGQGTTPYLAMTAPLRRSIHAKTAMEGITIHFARTS